MSTKLIAGKHISIDSSEKKNENPLESAYENKPLFAHMPQHRRRSQRS